MVADSPFFGSGVTRLRRGKGTLLAVERTAAVGAAITLVVIRALGLGGRAVVSPHVAMHIAIRGEGDSTYQTFERSLPRVHEDMAVQRARGTQYLVTDLAREGFEAIDGKILAVVVV